MFLQIFEACTVWVLTGNCCPCPEQNAGLAACLGATSNGQGDLQTAETPQGKCFLSPVSMAGMAPKADVPRARSCWWKGCFRADLGFAELQPRAGSGRWELFPEALSHMGLSAVVFFYSCSFGRRWWPSVWQSLGTRQMRNSAGGGRTLCSPLLCSVIPDTFVTTVPSAHPWSSCNSSQP